jgi:hypothetical protein
MQTETEEIDRLRPLPQQPSGFWFAGADGSMENV